MDDDLCWHADMIPAARYTSVCCGAYTTLMHAFNFSCMWPRVQICVWPLLCALLALCTCGACVKENDSGLCTVFTRKYVLATWRMYVWVSQGLFLSCNVNGVSCQLGGLVKWGQGRGGGGVGVVVGDLVACQWQKCNVLGYWLQEVLISR